MATSSQRLSFTSLVLDMGLADKKALLRAKKLIKERKAEGKKVTVARACVELEILTERQAKKVQRELRRLKEGFASSSEFRPLEDAKETIKKRKKRKKSSTGKTSDADKPVEAEEDAKPEAKKTKKRKKSSTGKTSDADKPVEAEEDAKPEAKTKKRKKKPSVADEPVADDDEKPEAKKAKTKKPSAADEPVADDDAEADDEPEAKTKATKAKKGKTKAKAKAKAKATEDADEAEAEAEAEDEEPKAKTKKGKKKPVEKPKKKAKVVEPESEEASEDAPASEEEPTSEAEPTSEEEPASEEEPTSEEEPSSEAEPTSEAEPDSEAEPTSEEAENDSLEMVDSESEPPEPKKKTKAKLGKEIQLDSQRTAEAPAKGKAGKGKEKKAKPAAKKADAKKTEKRRRGAASKPDAPTENKQSKAPLYAIGGVVALLVVGAIAFAFSGKDGKGKGKGGKQVAVKNVTPSGGDTPDPSAGGTPSKPGGGATNDSPKTPAEKRLAAGDQVERLVLQAAELADEGKFSEAIEKLQEFPQDLRDQPAWKSEGERNLRRWKALLPVQEKFESALSAAKKDDAGKEKLAAVVKEVLAEGYAFKGEVFVGKFKEAAKEILGIDTYQQLETDVEMADMNSGDDDDDDDDDDGGLGTITNKAAEVRRRGTPERRQALRARLSTFKTNLTQAQAKLRDQRSAANKTVREQEKRAKKLGGKINSGGKTYKLVALDASGFTVSTGGKNVKYSWGNCPAELGHIVKKYSIDPKDGDALWDLGMYALKRALFDSAKTDFDQASKRGSKRRVPNVDQYRVLAHLFRGRSQIAKDNAPSKVVWDFKEEKHLRDFAAMHASMKTELVGGALKISTPPRFLITAAKIHGAWSGNAKIEVQLATGTLKHGVAFESEAGTYMVIFSQQTEMYQGLTSARAAPLAKSDVRAGPGTNVTIDIVRSGDHAMVKVSVGDRLAFEHQVPVEGDISFTLGARGSGEVRYGNCSITGQLSQKWAKRTQASVPSVIARELQEFERQVVVQSGASSGMPVAYMETSAEDETALDGIPEKSREMLKNGREMLKNGNQGGGLAEIRKAAETNIEFHAANYMHALSQLRRDPVGALIRLERCVKGVEDFYEAMVAKSMALFWIGRYKEAETVLNEAVALRPDYAPAYVARANLFVVKGDYKKALDLVELAEVLGPGDPQTTQIKGQILALFAGPNWFNRKTSKQPHYALSTDMVAYADQFAQQLESIRARYEEAFPILIDPDAPKRQASVLIFSEPEGYYQYSSRTGVGRVENTLGHFNPWSGQLLLFLESDPEDWNSYHVIFHEGMHQWCHSNGLSLPFWANEGMAEYVGGTRLNEEGTEIKERGAIDSFLKKRLQNLTGNWKDRLDWHDIMAQSPSEFYAGNASMKYAQAYTMIHFMMESGDEELKKTFFKYLKHYKDVKGDPEKAKRLREGSGLEHVWADTFHQLKMKEVTKKWEAWVEKMCKTAGLGWKRPN